MKDKLIKSVKILGITLLIINLICAIALADDTVELINAPSELVLDNFVLPYSGGTYTSNLVISGNYPCKLIKSTFSKNGEDIANNTIAYAGDVVDLYVYVEINEGYQWPDTIKAKINDVEHDSIIVKDEEVKQIIFVWEGIGIDYTDAIVINDQSPEIVKFVDNDTIKLFVDASGAVGYQWRVFERVGKGKNKKINVSNVEGATSSEFIINNADSSLDGNMYDCVIKSENGEITSSAILLQLIEDSSNDKKVSWGNASDWAEIELNRANALGLIPEIFANEDMTKNITRKEFAHVAVKLFERMTGIEVDTGKYNPFTDTDDKEVLKAYVLGITQGTSNDTFEPDALITRAQMATMMARALSKAGVNTEVDLDNVERFVDDNEIDEWYVDSVYYMSEVGIIKGVGEGLFGPKNGATREASLLISERSAMYFAE